MSTVSYQIWFNNSFPKYNEPGLLGEMADSRIGAGNIQMSLENFVVPENERKSSDKSTMSEVWL